MNLSDFDYHLPKELIAQRPAQPRNHSRLLIYNRSSQKIIDEHFYNLEKYLPKDATLVLNNSKVEKCRLNFGSLEIFVTETINPTTIIALVRPGKKFALGNKVEINLAASQKLAIDVTDINPQGLRTLSLSLPIDDKQLDPFRLTPLPPYIKQDESLSANYQTVYAKPLGSKAAPTAGLHFTKRQLEEIRQHWPVAEITLHVGLGTFAPVKTDDLERHKLHSEYYEIDTRAAELINRAKVVTAVGTTSARTLESLRRPFQPTTGETDIFIKPGYRFKNVDTLITNFHLPKSTLLMLVAAFIGSLDETMRIYSYAVSERYRFYSFGDAMLIL